MVNPQAEAPSPRRGRLSRNSVVIEAIALADADGLDALSMRALAARLAVVPMALYKHVSDKEDLIGRMVDHVVAGYPDPAAPAAPAAEPSWRARVRSRVMHAHAAALAHPWLGRAIDTRRRRTETVLAHMNAVAGDFIEGGVSPDLAHYAMHALGNRIWGYSLEAFADADAPTPADAERPDVVGYMTERFPHVVTIARDAMRRNPSGSCEQQTEFEFTLDLLLDAVERLHAAGWVSRPEPTGAR